jgi:protein-tyrosine phosphatase
VRQFVNTEHDRASRCVGRTYVPSQPNGAQPLRYRTAIADSEGTVASQLLLLVVCTANVARSPLLAIRLQADLDHALGPGIASVLSAGTDASYGQSAAPGSLMVAEQWGLSLASHRSRSLAYIDISAIDLALVMTRRHRHTVTRTRSLAAERTFRVRELATIAGLVTDRNVSATASGSQLALDPMLQQLPALPLRARLGRRLDVPDPVGQPQRAYDDLGEEFTDASARICRLLTGQPPAR